MRGFLLMLLLLRGAVLEATNGTRRSHEHLARCELDSLLLGSHMADVINSPIVEGLSLHERVIQDFIAENLGFSPWVSHGIQGTNGMTLTKQSAASLQGKQGWVGKNISDSPYSILNHKWIYMFGDSTTRQVWASFAAPFQANNFERNAKEWTRQYCNKQDHRKRHQKGGIFPEEGWGGPCGVNEVTCYVSGYGDEGLLTFDWKHFPYEDYDDYVWGESGPWNIKKSERRPDIVTIQSGMHSCWHAHPEGLYSSHLKEANISMIDAHIASLDRLYRAVRTAVDRPTNASAPTTVVVLTSGSIGMASNGANIDNCILRINAATTAAAHAHGFAVLDRGEIERRLVYRSLNGAGPFNIETHLTQPAQNIISTCLLRLLTCLAITPEALGVKKYMEARARTVSMKPLHSPP